MPAWMRVSLIAALVVCLAGCSLRGKKAAAAAPPPKPAVPVAAVPDGPLSVPQTNVELPAEQPLDPKALEVAQQEPAPEPFEAAPPPKAPRRPGPVPAVALPQVEPPVAQAPPAEERPRLQELVSAEERRRLMDEIAGRKREINDVLQQAARRNLSDLDRTLVERIKSFLAQSDQAAGRDDIRQAEALSERALVLARELRGAR